MRSPRRTITGIFASGTGRNQFTAEVVSDAELVILCSLGPDRDARLTGRELRRRLIDAGFRPAATAHLVRSSRLLARSGDGRYALSGFFPVAEGAH